jgi:hypothetical protein
MRGGAAAAPRRCPGGKEACRGGADRPARAASRPAVGGGRGAHARPPRAPPVGRPRRCAAQTAFRTAACAGVSRGTGVAGGAGWRKPRPGGAGAPGTRGPPGLPPHVGHGAGPPYDEAPGLQVRPFGRGPCQPGRADKRSSALPGRSPASPGNTRTNRAHGRPARADKADEGDPAAAAPSRGGKRQPRGPGRPLPRRPAGTAPQATRGVGISEGLGWFRWSVW